MNESILDQIGAAVTDWDTSPDAARFNGPDLSALEALVESLRPMTATIRAVHLALVAEGFTEGQALTMSTAALIRGMFAPPVLDPD